MGRRDVEKSPSMCLFCFSGDAHPDDKYGDKPEKFETNLCGAPCKDPCCCPCGFFVFPIPLFCLRKKYLEVSGDEYLCCQGYFPGCLCIKPGKVGDKQCPTLCNCCESIFCPALGMSSTRMAVMDFYNLGSDPQDRQLIRLSNACQMLGCICNILAIVFSELREAARIITMIANCITFTIIGCMAAQVNTEFKKRVAK